jgi:uncharacterized protein (DUF2267 family)
MSYFPLRTFPDAAQQASLCVSELADRLDCEQQEAYEVLRAVLQALRDSMTVHDASELANCLPVLLRGIFFENWHPAVVIPARSNIDQVLVKIDNRLDCNELEGRQAIAEVFKILECRANPRIADKLRAISQAALLSTVRSGGMQSS